MDAPAPVRRPLSSLLSLLLHVGGSLLAGVLGGLATRSSVGSWYQTLDKPSWNPPSWVFGPVWSTLYVLMGIAAWGVWRAAAPAEAKRRAALLFWGQLVLNTLWSFLFFGLRSPGLALIEVLVLWAAILLTLRAFWRLRPLSGALLCPYLAWVSYAAALTAAIAWLNR
jgi:translocator protein